MCTVLLRLAPDAEWPVRIAFVRDEDRDRPSDPPSAWWPDLPRVIGGRDARAGGTWLAVDADRPPAAALLTDQFDPAATIPDPAISPTRGRLPLLALERGAHFDLEADAPGGVDVYQPFHLVTVLRESGSWAVERWGWNGTRLDHELLPAGDHVVASRAPTLPGELRRRSTLLDQLGAIHPESGWAPWIELLDSRDVQPGDLDRVAIHSISQRPGFGTVGATLLSLAEDGRVHYQYNRTHTLDPAAWEAHS